MASALFEAKRNSTEAVAVWLIHIHFDAFLTLPAKDFYFSSTENIDFPVSGVDKVFRKGYMKGLPKGRHQRDRDNDYCEFAFSNDKNATYKEFKPYEQIIERGEITIFHCLEIDKDYYEGETRFFGYLQSFTISESDKSLKFTAFSDMSRKGFPVGARILTREGCGTEFNFGGLAASNAFRGCTWQLIQGGNPDFCSRFLKGVDGCVAHGNAHQFFAVSSLSTAAIEFVPPSEVDFPYENEPCFTEDNYIVNVDWTLEPISYAKKGQIIKAFDIYTGDLVDAEVLSVQTHIVESFCEASFESGTDLYVTKNHLFNTNGSKFQPIGVLEGEQVSGRDKRKNAAKDRLKSLTEVSGRRVAVYNLRTTANTYIITSRLALFYLFVHNSKPTTPMLG